MPLHSIESYRELLVSRVTQNEADGSAGLEPEIPDDGGERQRENQIEQGRRSVEIEEEVGPFFCVDLLLYCSIRCKSQRF